MATGSWAISLESGPSEEGSAGRGKVACGEGCKGKRRRREAIEMNEPVRPTPAELASDQDGSR